MSVDPSTATTPAREAPDGPERVTGTGGGKRPPPEALFVPAVEAAALIGISRRLFLQWDSSGRLGPRAAIRAGRVVRWDKAEIIAWAKSGAVPRTRWSVVREQVMRDVRRAPPAASC